MQLFLLSAISFLDKAGFAGRLAGFRWSPANAGKTKAFSSKG